LLSHFHTAPLVRLLGAWLPAPGEAPRQDVAQRLAQWLSVADAIALRGAQPGARSPRAKPPEPGPRAGLADDLTDQLQRLRATLVKSFAPLPVRSGQADPAHATDFAVHHQRYLDHQRRMDLSVEALRAHARQVLTTVSSELADLAEMDALLDQLLRERQQALLSRVPLFLKTRFQQLRPSTEASPDAASEERAATPAWLTEFEQALQACLRAELELRLQPLFGLAEALDNAPHGAPPITPTTTT
jgi:hypothetical protein